MSNEIQKTLDQDVQNLVARLGQSRKNGTGLMLGAGDVGVLHEALNMIASSGFVVVPKDTLEEALGWASVARWDSPNKTTDELIDLHVGVIEKAMIKAAQEKNHE